jgi:hypothetical protein
MIVINTQKKSSQISSNKFLVVQFYKLFYLEFAAVEIQIESHLLLVLFFALEMKAEHNK